MEALAHHNRRAGGGVNVGFLSGLFARIAGQKPEQSTEQTSPQQEFKMAKVLVLYHSMYGHIETVTK
jgi:NAD(P)H dehydrogenase (quinone)